MGAEQPVHIGVRANGPNRGSQPSPELVLEDRANVELRDPERDRRRNRGRRKAGAAVDDQGHVDVLMDRFQSLHVDGCFLVHHDVDIPD